ncbi:MAG: type II and III secretion system family protein [Alphaproteobacteria bacterium]|nr:type II and III secretion system family protein [Alphaproteobacteria bacterium]MCD8562649.1 type II and III secretion system family protein [Alphaproteobacteria bacterium]
MSAGNAMKGWGCRLAALVLCVVLLSSCADVSAPGTRHLDVEAPASPKARQDAINERPDSVIFLPLGSDVLVPESLPGDPLPQTEVGPFELRSETLAGALQLIMADYEVPMAFETDEGLTRTITVANLRGPMGDVVKRVCSLADLYCSYEDGVLVVKEYQTFTVTIPPLGGDSNVLTSLATGLQAITGTAPITDEGTRTIVYTATNRTAQLAERYFQKIRSNTALIVYEIYIWQVSLNAANSTGIDWQKIQSVGKFNTGINFPGGSTLTDVTPISIGLPTTGPITFGADDVFQFISTYGAVKTVSQPQVTMLSGGEASLRVAETRNYVSQLSRTVDNGETSVSSQTDTVDSGFTLKISSAWDNATVYGTVELSIQDFQGFKPFSAGENLQLQLPEMTENELTTQVRVRPGDSLLIAGLVQSDDQYNKQGPGFMEPLLSLSRDATVSNSELVILLRPRVVVYTSEGGGYNQQLRDRRSRAGLPEANPNVFGTSEKSSGATAVSKTPEPVSLLDKPQEQHSYPQGSLSKDLLDPAL